MINQLESQLKAPTAPERLAALRRIADLYQKGGLDAPRTVDSVNNHIHTCYSFSPYSPSNAVYTAWKSGLSTAGIIDHDSVSGAKEFIEAGEILGLAATVGFECRCYAKGTPFHGKRINNPDQLSIVYMTMHGIPHQSLSKAEDFLRGLRELRNKRNRAMVEKINSIIAPMSIDFERDVLPLSCYQEGGSVTERHLLFALAKKLVGEIGRGEVLLDYLAKHGAAVSGASREKLLDVSNSMYEYYLLGVLKSGFVSRFYIDADKECPPIDDFIALGKDMGAIVAYPYLGDVVSSVTGDKKAQEFEDSYLDELFEWLHNSGVNAVTYMPTRNTIPQLKRVMELCRRYNMFQVSGEDINMPFQPFICDALQKPEFKHLITSTWALIGHERAASGNIEDGMFSDKSLAEMPDLDARIEFFAGIGRG